MKITQTFTFEAAHHLPKVPETHRCRRMHGHSYRVEVSVEGAVDPETGFIIDFFELEAALAPALKQLDHHCLNEIEGLENPTVENIAMWIWNKLLPSLPLLSGIKIYETPNCWAEYTGR